jgi:arsenite-transporting ATPase
MQNLANIQKGYRSQIYDLFTPLPIWEAPHYARDISGLKDLSDIGNALFKDIDPIKVQFRGSTQEIVKDGEDYIMRMPLPHVELGKVSLTKRGDELFIEIGNFRRDMILPMSLADRPAERASFRNGILEVRFGTPEHSSDVEKIPAHG